MARQTWLADAARLFGLNVVEVNGWQSRGSTDFNPRGGVAHHTAGPSGGGDMPSLNVLINGRSDLPGPLCNYGLGRSGTVYVVAAGRANHAGNGGWKGLSGNSSVVGIEAENDGYQPWPQAQTLAYRDLCAAVCYRTGISPDLWCRHHEWRAEKPDPHDVDGWTGRGNIAARLALGPAGLPEQESPPMFVQDPTGAIFIVSGSLVSLIGNLADLAELQKGAVDPNHIAVVSQKTVDGILAASTSRSV